MKINGIIWLEDIVEKLWQKHGVEENEVVEVLKNKSTRFRFIEKGHREGENVYAALGQTDAGRYIVVFFVYKKYHQVLVVSARNMTKTERKRYERK